MTDFRREIRPTLNRGELRVNWYLHGPKASVQFVLRIAKGEADPRWPSLPTFRIDPWDIGLHYREAPDHARFCGKFDDCDVIGGKCWYDGSSLAPEELLRRLLTEPDLDADSIWTELEGWYENAVNNYEEAA